MTHDDLRKAIAECEFTDGRSFRALATPARILALLDELAAKDARIAELEKALKPFADEASNWRASVPDDLVPIIFHPGDCPEWVAEDALPCSFMVGHLRAASKAYGGAT